MAKQHPAPSQRGTGPGATQTYVAGTGAAVCISHGPLDATNVVCMTVGLLPGASWADVLPFINRMAAYYAANKDLAVMKALGVTGNTDAAAASSLSMFGFSGTAFWYHVLPTDVTSETTALTALVTSANCNKGGNP